MFGLVLSVGRSAASVPSHVSFIHLRLLRSECSNTPSKSVNWRTNRSIEILCMSVDTVSVQDVAISLS